jgi:hypothetical protein
VLEIRSARLINLDEKLYLSPFMYYLHDNHPLCFQCHQMFYCSLFPSFRLHFTFFHCWVSRKRNFCDCHKLLEWMVKFITMAISINYRLVLQIKNLIAGDFILLLVTSLLKTTTLQFDFRVARRCFSRVNSETLKQKLLRLFVWIRNFSSLASSALQQQFYRQKSTPCDNQISKTISCHLTVEDKVRGKMKSPCRRHLL